MQTCDQTIGIVGAGSMGGAIARGLVASGTCKGSQVMVCDHHADRLAELEGSFGIRTFADLASLLEAGPQVLLLAVKPQVLDPVLLQVADRDPGRLVISIAAGVTLSTLSSALPASRVVRVMPNLPVSVRSGASAVAASDAATPADVDLVVTLFSSLGSAFVLREDQLDVEGAVVGCAPAFFALFVDAFTRAGIRAGLPASVTREMLETTMRGTAASLLEDGMHPRVYLEGVTSPGGTTAAALRVLEEPVMQAADDAIDEALMRTKELAGDK